MTSKQKTLDDAAFNSAQAGPNPLMLDVADACYLQSAVENDTALLCELELMDFSLLRKFVSLKIPELF